MDCTNYSYGIVNLARVPVREPPLLQGVGCLAVQAGHFVPGCKPDCPRGSVAGSGDSVSVGSEVSGDGIKDGEETLCLLRRFKPPHPPLALSGRLM
jgi:hypothetical protein